TERLRCLRARATLHSRHFVGLPGARRDPCSNPSNGRIQELAVKLTLQPLDQVFARLNGVNHLNGLAAALGKLLTAAVPEIAPGMTRNGLKPGTETTARVVNERPHLVGQFQ